MGAFDPADGSMLGLRAVSFVWPRAIWDLVHLRPRPCTCIHARRDHYGGLDRLANVGPCKVKACPCRKYALATATEAHPDGRGDGVVVDTANDRAYAPLLR